VDGADRQSDGDGGAMMRSIAASAILAVIAALTVTRAHALEPGAFGWRAAELAGSRPLLAIWVREPDDTPPAELAKYARYFQDTLFGRTAPAPGPDRDRFEPSVAGYYAEVSAGKFTFTRAGLIGPLVASVKGKPPLEVARLALAAAAHQGFDFTAFDSDRDHRVAANELAVLVIVSGPGRGWQNLAPADREFAIPSQDVAFTGRLAIVGENDGLATVNRELFHVIQPEAIDLDGSPQKCFSLNRGLSLMAAVNSSNPRQTMHLDPWHKMQAGWIEPRVVVMGSAGKAKLAAQHLSLPGNGDLKRPLLFYDGTRGTSEFFLMEYRTRSALGFDQDVGTSGLVIWHVALDRENRPLKAPADRTNCKGENLPIRTLFVRGAPDWQLGVSRAYTSGNGPISLKWLDGTDSGVRVSVGEHLSINWAIEISWTAGAPAAGH
jgi:M6 family metalloprotease-like protein